MRWSVAAAARGSEVELLPLTAEGIAADPGFRGLHLIHARSRFRAASELSHATDADTRCVTLHHPVLLGERGDMEQIAAAVDKIRRHATMVRTSDRQ